MSIRSVSLRARIAALATVGVLMAIAPAAAQSDLRVTHSEHLPAGTVTG